MCAKKIRESPSLIQILVASGAYNSGLCAERGTPAFSHDISRSPDRAISTNILQKSPRSGYLGKLRSQFN